MRQISLCVLAAFMAVSCTHRVPVMLSASPASDALSNGELASVRPALVFRRGSFADKRADTTKLAMFKQGVHTYNLHAERPVQDALFDGIGALLTGAGHRWADADTAAAIRIDLQLLNLQASRNAGLINVGASSSIQLRLDFADARTGQAIYSEIYNGTDERARAMIGLMSMVRESLNASVVNALTTIGRDPKLAAALRRQ